MTKKNLHNKRLLNLQHPLIKTYFEAFTADSFLACLKTLLHQWRSTNTVRATSPAVTASWLNALLVCAKRGEKILEQNQSQVGAKLVWNTFVLLWRDSPSVPYVAFIAQHHCSSERFSSGKEVLGMSL